MTAKKMPEVTEELLTYLGEKRASGTTNQELAKELGLSVSAFKKGIQSAGYIYNATTKKYELKNTEETPEEDNTPQPQHEDTTKKSENTTTTQTQHETTNTTQPPEKHKKIVESKKSLSEEEKLRGLEELLEIKDQLKALVKTQEDKQELSIDAKLFSGALNSRNFKLYKNVSDRLNKFIEANKLYKTQDIVNYALLYFLDNFEK